MTQLLTDDMRRRLVEAREAKGWTCWDVSKYINRSTAYWFSEERVGAWESGLQQPPFEVLAAWCEALGLKLKVETE